jgi:antitoxin ParD1/3/4/toxin ParE1/3/4
VSGYVLSTDADLDLDEIWEYIAADRWITKLFEAFEALAEAPGMGHRRSDLTTHPVLFWPVGAYLIIYQVRENRPTEIVAVTQGSRRVPSSSDPNADSHPQSAGVPKNQLAAALF